MINDILILPDGSRLCGGEPVSILSLTYTQKVNAEENFMPGCACAAGLEVKLLDETGSFSIAPGTALRHYRGERFMGTFYAEKAVHSGKYALSFNAYDAMVKAERDLTAWLATLPDWPYTIKALLELVCEKCGIPLDPEIVLCNGDYPVLRFARNVTGRQIIGWAAQANGAYAYVDTEGVLKFGNFAENPTPITDSCCKTLTLADAPCAPIEAVAIGQGEADLAAVWPEKPEGECLHITGNPLLTAFSQEELTACARNIYALVAGFTYTPLEAEVFAEGDVAWQPGQLVWAQGQLCAVFEMQLTGAGAKLKSTGTQSRASAAARYSRDKVELLQGQMARVEETITGISAQVGKVTTELQELEVGGRNRILSSRTLEEESYYFSGGGATSDTATVTGNPLVITDADPGKPQLQLEIPEEATVLCCGKNLIAYPYYYSGSTIGGVEFAVQNDGTLILNGTATQQALFYLSTYATGVHLPAGTVATLSGTPEGYGGKCFVQCSDSKNYVTDPGGGTVFTAGADPYGVYVVVNAGTVLENVTVKPQIELGAGATEFESYSGTVLTSANVQQATARFPVTTLVADGEITVTYNRITLLTQVQQTPPEGDDPVLRFTVDTLPQSFVMPGLMTPGQVYTLSFWAKGEGTLTIAGQENSLTGNWEKYVATFTPEGEELALEFVSVGTFDLYHPQLEKGSVATDWSAAPEDGEAVLLTTREELSGLQVASDQISAQVSQTETATRADLELVQTEVQSLKKQTQLTVTEDQMTLAISTALEQGSRKVVTRTGYTFDEAGLTIATDRSDIRNQLDHTGMLVMRADEVLLRADTAGVTARDVTVDNYLIIGSHARVEDYPNNRTACFWR